MELFHRRSPLCFQGWAVSDTGCQRANNEDNFLLDGCLIANPDTAKHHEAEAPGQAAWHVMGVFDGIGGGEKGELAAKTAAECFRRGWLELKLRASGEKTEEVLRRCFLEANNRIISLKREHTVCGTTGTVACTDGSVCKVFHLGDSRGYLFRNGELFQLTRDQTLAQMKKTAGRCGTSITEADRHTLTEFIGCDGTRQTLRPLESQWIPIQPGDRLLLCSDGLYDMCDTRQISCILREAASARMAARTLNRAALQNGGRDNVTCLVVDFN